MEDSGINSLAHTPLSASSSRTEGSGINCLAHTPLSAEMEGSGLTHIGSDIDGHNPHITSPFDTETDQSQCDQEYKTKLAMSISKAFGSDSTIKSFDNIRYIIKTRKHQGLKACNAQIHKHELLKNQLSTRLSEKKNKLKQEIKSYEHDYFKRQGLLPRPTTDEYYHSLTKKRNYIKWLLSTWKTNGI